MSRTLEFAYGDFYVALMAEALGHDADASRFRLRADSWRAVLDRAVASFVAAMRMAHGCPWIHTHGASPIVEGNAWHYTWAVPHDIPGLTEALGGRRAMAARRDSFLRAPPTVHTGSYGRMIHEMNELGNQPCHHVLYLI